MSRFFDCQKTSDYLVVRAKATQLDDNGFCHIHCDECILKQPEITSKCEVLEYHFPEEAIKILQAYADEHLNSD